jgi:hypothetical protein
MFNVQWAMDQPMDLNLVSRLWKKLFSHVLLCAQLFEFMKMAKLAINQIMGFMEDERTFSTLTFMKTRLHNHMYEHLDLVVQMFTQPFYIVDTFPCDDAIITWTKEKARWVFWLDVFYVQCLWVNFSFHVPIYFSIKFTTPILQHSSNGSKFYSMQEKGLYSSLSLIQNAAQKV